MKKRYYLILISLLFLLFLFFLMPTIKKGQKRQQFDMTYQAYNDYYLNYKTSHRNLEGLETGKKDKFRRLILIYAKKLSQDGWKSTAIQKGFLNQLSTQSTSEDFQKLYQDIQIIGSKPFKLIWYFQDPSITPKQAHSDLQLLLHYLNLPEDLIDSKDETALLLSKFDSTLSPTDPFWDQLSFLVQLNYNDLSRVSYSPFNQKIHQLRYLISAQQSQWVRRYYQESGETDAQALAKYLASLDREQYSLYESSRYHNKVADIGNQLPVYSDNMPQNNYKVLIHFHSEFILSESGEFLSPLDYQHSNRNSIVNGASFNYANANNDLHQKLDILPIDSLDPEFVKMAMLEAESKFLEPDLHQQKDKKNPIYSRDGKSSKQLTKAAIKKFKKLLKIYQKSIQPNQDSKIISQKGVPFLR